MKIEWSAHNLVYHSTKNEVVNGYISNLLNEENANVSSRDVDILGVDKRHGFYKFVTLGGIIEW